MGCFKLCTGVQQKHDIGLKIYLIYPHLSSWVILKSKILIMTATKLSKQMDKIWSCSKRIDRFSGLFHCKDTKIFAKLDCKDSPIFYSKKNVRLVWKVFFVLAMDCFWNNPDLRLGHVLSFHCIVLRLYNSAMKSCISHSWFQVNVHIFWESHKILRNLHLTFGWQK